MRKRKYFMKVTFMKTSSKQKKAMEQLGIEKLRKHQIEPINALDKGQDCFIVLATSAGKSAIPQLVGLMKPGYTLNITPTLSLMDDQVKKLKAHTISAEYVCCANKDNHKRIYNDLADGKIKFLYVTPERLRDKAFKRTVKKMPPDIIVVDEVHCLTQWGNPSFRPAYASIGDFIENLKVRPVIAAMTATAPPDEREHIERSLGMRNPSFFTGNLAKPNLTAIIENCDDRSEEQQLKLLRKKIKKYIKDGSAVIYCSTKAQTDVIYNYLKSESEFKKHITRYHSGMNAEQRELCENDFLNGKKNIMIATSAFAMGVDKSDIRLVLHWNMPFSIVDYYQQIGRAGRDGNPAHAVLFYRSEDIKMNKEIIGGKKRKRDLEEIGSSSDEIKAETKDALERFQVFTDILQGKDCIVQRVLEYLGEKDPKKCRYCTMCQRNRRKYNND